MIRVAVASAAVWLCATSIAHAGAWLQPPGKGLTIMQATYFTGDEFFNADSEREAQSRFSKFELQPYVEYGLTEKITIGGSVFLHRVQQSGDTNDGLADSTLFVRTAIWQNATDIVSVEPRIKLPSAYENGGEPRGGSRSVDGELSLLYGRNQPIIHAKDYLDSRMGYRWRSRGLAPVWLGDITLGLHASERITLLPALRIWYADEAGDAFAQTGDQDSRYMKAELGIAYALDTTRSLLLTLADIIEGTNAGAGSSISIGYAEQF